jgi:hypothetical protein
MERDPALPEHGADGGGADRAAGPPVSGEPVSRPSPLVAARAVAAAVWDMVTRIWLVTAARLGFGRTAARRLAQITEPRRFVAAAIAPASRSLALAIAFLPRSRRCEAAIAVLAGRALRALYRLADPATARDQVSAAIGYLADEATATRGAAPEFEVRLAPCDAGQGRDRDRLDAVLAARIPVLRAALEALPDDARWRCRDAIDRIGEGMLHVRADRPGLGRVYVEAVVYAARLAAPQARAPLAACKAAGRGLRFARYLDGSGADRDVVLDRALPALAFVPRLWRWLPATTDAGVRAAATYATLTAMPLSAHAFGVAPPRRLRHPLRAALAAAWSRRSFLATADALDAMLHATRRALVERLDGPAVATAPLAVPPDAVVSDAALLSLALELSQTPAEANGAPAAERRTGPLIPAGDGSS